MRIHRISMQKGPDYIVDEKDNVYEKEYAQKPPGHKRRE
jgi:hypothetical protein